MCEICIKIQKRVLEKKYSVGKLLILPHQKDQPLKLTSFELY